MTRSELPFDSVVATGKGDDGTTGLLFGGARVRKDDPRTDAYGTVDEAVAALGLARAELGAVAHDDTTPPDFGDLAGLILRIQRELFVVGAELATNPDARDRQQDGTTRVSRAMVDAMGSFPPPARAYAEGIGLDALIARGGIVVACEFAFWGITQRVMNRDKVPEAEAREKALSHLVPGVSLVPSGFLALAVAQQQGCSFVTNT